MTATEESFPFPEETPAPSYHLGCPPPASWPDCCHSARRAREVVKWLQRFALGERTVPLTLARKTAGPGPRAPTGSSSLAVVRASWHLGPACPLGSASKAVLTGSWELVTTAVCPAARGDISKVRVGQGAAHSPCGTGTWGRASSRHLTYSGASPVMLGSRRPFSWGLNEATDAPSPWFQQTIQLTGCFT